MTVAIIGTGKMGSGISKLLASKGVEVVIGHRDPAKATKLAEEIGGRAQGGGVAAAVKLADVVILAVWYQHIADAIRDAGDLSGKVVVDISNPITDDFKGLSVGFNTSAAEEIQKLAPKAKVVKAFNTVFAELLPPEAAKTGLRLSRSSSLATMKWRKKPCRTLWPRGTSNPSSLGRCRTQGFLSRSVK